MTKINKNELSEEQKLLCQQCYFRDAIGKGLLKNFEESLIVKAEREKEEKLKPEYRVIQAQNELKAEKVEIAKSLQKNVIIAKENAKLGKKQKRKQATWNRGSQNAALLCDPPKSLAKIKALLEQRAYQETQHALKVREHQELLEKQKQEEYEALMKATERYEEQKRDWISNKVTSQMSIRSALLEQMQWKQDALNQAKGRPHFLQSMKEGFNVSLDSHTDCTSIIPLMDQNMMNDAKFLEDRRKRCVETQKHNEEMAKKNAMKNIRGNDSDMRKDEQAIWKRNFDKYAVERQQKLLREEKMKDEYLESWKRGIEEARTRRANSLQGKKEAVSRCIMDLWAGAPRCAICRKDPSYRGCTHVFQCSGRPGSLRMCANAATKAKPSDAASRRKSKAKY